MPSRQRWSRRGVVSTVALLATLGSVVAVPAVAAGVSPQSPLVISNSLTQSRIGTTIHITTVGGSGSGAVTFAASGAHCVMGAMSGNLRASQAATCVVRATKAASGPYRSRTSPAVTFVFKSNPATLRIANTVLTGQVGVGLLVTTTGATGTGVVTFDAGGVCSINPVSGQLSAQSVGSCPVTATQAPSRGHDGYTTVPVTFTFSPGPQAALTITNDPLTGSVGTPLTVFTSGGSGTGNVTFSVTGTDCTIDPASGALSATNTATCIVTAQKDADGNYLATTSAPAAFSFTVAGGTGGTPHSYAHPDQARLTSVTGASSNQINDTVNGDRNFIIQYFHRTDNYYIQYVKAGATVTLTWHVTNPDGDPLTNFPVTLIGNMTYSCAKGVTWNVATLNINNTGGAPGRCPGAVQGHLAGMTDANGDVSFTLVNTNTATGADPADMTSTSAAESNEEVYNWTCMVLKIGNDVITAAPSSSVNEAVDRIDFIIIP